MVDYGKPAIKAANLFRMTRNAHLKYEELETLLLQIEAILNSRPFTSMSSDSNDLIPLTPGHFLIGNLLISYLQPSFEKVPSNRLSRWQYIEQLRQHF